MPVRKKSFIKVKYINLPEVNAIKLLIQLVEEYTQNPGEPSITIVGRTVSMNIKGKILKTILFTYINHEGWLENQERVFQIEDTEELEH